MSMSGGAVLALELSTARGSVAVVAPDGAVLFEAEFGAGRSHNALLFEPLREALAAAGDRLGGIVVGTGPGSYTGVRIAIAAAQGVALSRKVPVAGLSSLLGCVDAETYGVVGDARRGRFYVTVVRAGNLASEIALVQPEALAATMSAAGVSRWVSCDETPPTAGIELAQPSARRLALRALSASLTWEADKPLEPLYLEGAFITQARKR